MGGGHFISGFQTTFRREGVLFWVPLDVATGVWEEQE